jgi:hypothetical protein
MPGGFYDQGPLAQIAINLFYGWGYNFYRTENQLRADDQLIRAQVDTLLQQARAAVETAESDYRHAFLPPPSRAKPRHDPEHIANVQKLEKISADIGALGAKIRALPVPENDRMSQRYRVEAETLIKLGQIDQQLTGQAELLRQMLAGKDGAWIIENKSALTEGITAITETLRARQSILLA